MKYIIGNWKMNLSLKQAEALTLGIIQFLKETPPSSFSCMIAPPFPFLERLHTLITHEKDLLSLAAQDISAHEKGAFTGEVSASHLKEVGVKAALIGHSERRLYHKETEPLLRQKILQCLSHDLIPVLCLGESLEIRRASKTVPFVLNQLHEMCQALQEMLISKPSSSPPLMIAYEPLWAIGTGCIPSLDEIEDVHNALSIALKTLFPKHIIPLLYGGSVTPLNSSEILSLPHVDGALVGGASLSLETFLPLLSSASLVNR
ncbi:MAG TPA: triose-phosphate isomerase [Alphaproteobacteria bacterium]|nr:triose-phosphate isomerase [Alphaproteobacteria bacterium]HQS94043.1 triose-phosphate isomerase [Alphaproteobacteria bacterium]